MEGLERPDRVGKIDVLDLAQRLLLDDATAFERNRERRVVVEDALHRVDDLVVQRGLGILGKPSDQNLDRGRLIHRVDPGLGEDVHHARRQPTVGNDAEVLPCRSIVKLPLLLDDLGVAAQVAVVGARLHGELRRLEIEEVRQGAEHTVDAFHRLTK